MIKRIKDYIHNFSIKEKSSRNKKVIRFTIFVGIATIFWFLNALSKDYVTTVSYPVNYENIPKDKVVTNELPNKLSLEVKGYGFALMRYKITTAFLPITINVTKYSKDNVSDNNVFHSIIHLNEIKNRINKQLSKDIQLIRVSPDTIGLHFSKIIKKRLPIVAKTKVTYSNQFNQCGKITTAPDSVDVYAASVILDTLKHINTEEISFENLNKTVKRNISLEEIKGVRYGRKRLIVTIPVDQFISSEKEVKITVDNLPENKKLVLFPSKVKIKYKVGFKDFKHIDANLFRVSVDYNNTSSLTNILKINLDSYPEAVSNIELSSSNVEYIIEKDE
ncbi:MAG: hypothetical protein N4A32_01965 [Marinifilaceae bacterium]|jgi:hypothetical protein|nr:hypothetical protein [Marinifilaceae bacterium]